MDPCDEGESAAKYPTFTSGGIFWSIIIARRGVNIMRNREQRLERG